MAELDEHALLRDLTQAIAEGRAYEAARRDDPLSAEARHDPYERRRWVSTRGTLETLLARRGDPAAPYLAAWVRALLGARVNHEAEREALAGRASEVVRLTAPEAREVPLRAALRLLLGERDGAIAGATAAALGRVPGDAAARAFDLWARRGELARRLAMPEAEALLSPLAQPEALDALARRALDGTDDAARGLARGRRSWHEALTADEHVEVPWPRAAGARQIIELFRGEAGWLDMPDVSMGKHPLVLGASSFARALARFGARWADVAASRQLPAPLARHPNALARLETGALIASLPTNPAFVARAWGFSRGEADRAARSVARAGLLALRLAAARVLLRGPALAGDRRGVLAAIDEHVGRALCAPPPPSALALVVPRLHLTDPSRLVAFGQAAALAESLRDRHDEDWFRNPRAVVDLRDRLERAPRPHVARDEVASALDLAGRALAERAS